MWPSCAIHHTLGPMSSLLLAILLILPTDFETKLNAAFASIRNNDWATAASALDEANTESPDLFDANNLHYLRGRVAENQRDWSRALADFKQVESDNSLYTLAA